MPNVPVMTRSPVVALVQMSCTDDRQTNVARAVQQIANAAERGANVVCLQELFAGLYPCQTEDHARFEWAESLDGPTAQSLAEAARQYGVVVVGSLFERRAAGVYHNTAVVFDVTGQLVGVYRKMHIPDYPAYYEKFYFSPGDLGFCITPTRFGKIGVGVCWDQWFPETARLLALAGAELLFFPTAIGWLLDERATYGESQYNAWQTVMRSHAIANGIYVAAPNRVGREGGIQFWGGSFVSDPYGNLLARAAHEEEELLIVECDLSRIETARTHWPFLRDRRIDAYGGLLHRWLEPTSGMEGPHGHR
jgi:N-carbamoylputrescine amidase